MDMIALLVVAAAAQVPEFSPPELVPAPRHAEPRFAPFELPDVPRVVATAPEFFAVAEVLRQHIEILTGRPAVVAGDAARSGDLVLMTGYLSDEIQASDEGFSIEVLGDSVILSGATVDGTARAAARVVQLLEYERQEDRWTMPAVRIEDAPQLGWRGIELDVARFPHPLEAVEEAIDLAYLWSLNTVHLHLSDDQAFTFPASFLPDRTNAGERGEHRGYTRAELERLVDHALARRITLIPEIDMPAHASSLVRARPDLFGTKDADSGEWRSTGIINMASETAYESTAALLGEVAEVFHASPMIHLGGDEVWIGSIDALPEFPAYAEAHGLPGPGDPGAGEELLNHFLKRMTKVVEDLDRRAVLWEGFRPPSSSENMVPKDVVVMSWSQHSQRPEDLIEAGYQIVNCGWEPLYVVPAQGWAARPERALDWTPRDVRQRFGGRTVTLDEDAPVLGAQVCMWEQRPEAVVPALNRVMPEIALRMWGTDAPDEFARLAETARRRIESVLRPVEIVHDSASESEGTLFEKRALVSLGACAPLSFGTIRYEVSDTFDTPVTARSEAWTGEPITLEASAVVSAGLFSEEGNQIAGTSRIRVEKGTPVLEYEAREISATEPFEPEQFDTLWGEDETAPDARFLARGVLAAPDEARIGAINRELFARVDPAHHVDLRPLRIGEAAGHHRIDRNRPRLWGRHAVLATGQIEIPKAGRWTIGLSSRSGIARVSIGGKVVARSSGPLVETAGTLEPGVYSIAIEQAVPHVHNDVQLWLLAPSAESRETIYQYLLPTAAHRPAEELTALTSPFE